MQSVFSRNIWQCVLMHLQTRKDFLNVALVCKAAASASRDCRDTFADRFMCLDKQLDRLNILCHYLDGGRPYLHGPWFDRKKKKGLQFFSIGTRLPQYYVEDCGDDMTPDLAMRIWKTRDFHSLISSTRSL